MSELRPLPALRSKQLQALSVCAVRAAVGISVDDWESSQDHVHQRHGSGVVDKDLDKDVEKDTDPITHVFALLWLCPEGDRVTFAEVLLRAVCE